MGLRGTPWVHKTALGGQVIVHSAGPELESQATFPFVLLIEPMGLADGAAEQALRAVITEVFLISHAFHIGVLGCVCLRKRQGLAQNTHCFMVNLAHFLLLFK